MEDYLKFFDGKSILIIGGTGSVGSTLVNFLLRHSHPNVIRIYSRDEHKQFEMQQKILDKKNILRYLVGDVRDLPRLKTAMENIDIVFHAAALKHVPSCEYNPFEAVKTNILGTQNVIEAALDHEVDKVIFISTDKAVNPVNTMGASKLLAERITINSNVYKGQKKTKFSVVRFGNVLSSRGSVLTIFENQIEKGEPVTLTNGGMTRFIMSLEEAVQLILKSASSSVGGEVFILKMPVVRISDLLGAVIKKAALKYGKKPEEIEIKTIGSREGEKFYEELMTENEASLAYETDDMFVVLSTQLPGLEKRVIANHKKLKKSSAKIYSSKTILPLNIEQIEELLSEVGL